MDNSIIFVLLNNNNMTNESNIQFYILKENIYGDLVKHIVTPEPSELRVGLSSQKCLPKGLVSMVKPLRTVTLYYETIL